MLYKRDLFDKDKICIFTDASYCNDNNGSSCSGYCIYHDDILIEQDYHIDINTTTQRGELYAILMGINASYKYRNYEINLFSDSQTSIFAIRDRYSRWYKDTMSGMHVLGDDGTIKNQDLISAIVTKIAENRIPVSLYHNKGHVRINYERDIAYAKNVFKKSNYISEDIEDLLILRICNGNNQVDEYTRFMLSKYLEYARYHKSAIKMRGIVNPYIYTMYNHLVKRF